MPGELNLGTMYTSLELRTTRLEQSLAQATARFDSAGKTIESRAKQIRENVGKPLEDLGRTFSMAVSAPLLGLGVAAVRAATQMDSLKRGLTAVSGSSAETEKQLKRLNEVAKLPGLGLKEAIQGSINLQAAGFSAKQAERSLMAFGNALATVGKGKDALAAVNVQLTQMANKQGAIGEDIRALASWVPQLRTAMMHVFGTADTEAISKAGITGKQVVQALTAELERLPKVTGGIQNSFENLSDQLWKSLGELGKSLLPAVGRATDDLTQKLQVAATWWKNLSSGMQDAILKGAAGLIGVGGITYALGKVVGMVTTAIEAFAALKTAIIATKVAAAVPTPGGGAGAGAAAGGLAGRLSAGVSNLGGGPGALAVGSVYGLWQSLTKPGYLQQFGRGMGTFGTPPLGVRAGAGTNLAPLTQPPAHVFNPFGAGVQITIPPPEDPVVARLRAKVAAALGASEARNAAAAGRRAATSARQRERLDLAVQNAMGFGWTDPGQLLAQYLGWQKEGEAQQISGGLGDMVRALIGLASRGYRGAAVGGLSSMMGGAMGGMSAAFGAGLARAQQWQREVTFPKWMTGGLMGSLQSVFGGVMGIPDTAAAAAAQQARQAQFQWEEEMAAFQKKAQGMGKLEQSFRRQFEFLPDLAGNLADEFTDAFGRGMERAFGRNPFGRALGRSLTRMVQTLLDSFFTSGIQTEGEGGGGGGINVGALLGKIGIGAALGGLGSLFGGLFQEGGVVPGPPGRAKLAVVHGGEVVLNQRQQAAVAGGITINMGGVTMASDMDVERVSRTLAWQIRRELRAEVGR